MTEPQPTAEAQHRNMFVLRALVVFGFAFLLLAVAPHAAHALDLGDPVGTVTDTIDPVTDTIDTVTDTVGQVVDPVTATVGQVVEPVTGTLEPVTDIVNDTLDPVTQTGTDPPVVVPVDPPAVPQPPGSSSEPPTGHGAGHHDATTVGSTAGSAEAKGLVAGPPASPSDCPCTIQREIGAIKELIAETGISPVPTPTFSTSRSPQPYAPTPSSGQPIPALPPIAGAAAGQLVGGGSAGLNFVAVLAAAIALAFGLSRWFRLVQPSRLLAPFVSLAERPG